MDIKKVIEELKGKVQIKENELNILKNELEVLEKYMPTPTSINKAAWTKVGKITFKDAINNFLDDGLPKKKIELLELYRVHKNNPTYKLTSFSPQLSQLKTIKLIELDGKPQEDRFYYGKASWFDGETLKDEYLEKIK